MAANDFRVVQAGRVIELTANGSTAINVGEMVTLASNVITITGNNQAPIGMALTDIAINGVGPVMIEGIFEGTADGTDFAMGQEVYMEPSGVLGDGAAGEVSIGRVVNTNPAASGLVQFWLHSSLNTLVTHS